MQLLNIAFVEHFDYLMSIPYPLHYAFRIEIVAVEVVDVVLINIMGVEVCTIADYRRFDASIWT